MNTAFFIGSKMIMKKTSVNLMNMMNKMTNSNSDKTSTPEKSKMKGPDIDIENLP
jgi:hypothetical protein